jgi:hypothetical protein
LTYRVVDAIACDPGRIGCALSHIKILTAPTDERPLLVLEDDVAATEDFSSIIAVPTDADALYLGISTYGAVEALGFKGVVNMTAAEPVGAGLFRVHNMLTTHAILYLTPRWRAAAVAAIMDGVVARNWPVDRGLARAQRHFNIYALAQPFFYQAESLQPEGKGALQEGATNTVLSGHAPGARITVHLGDSHQKDLGNAREVPAHELTHAVIDQLRGGPRDIQLVRSVEGLSWLWAEPQPTASGPTAD